MRGDVVQDVVWGSNESWQHKVPLNLTGVIAVSAGDFCSLALKSDGTVVAWGFGKSGNCHVPSNLTEVSAISAGMKNSLALKNDGTIVE